MKKELNKANKKLTLGKMTVAKLQMSKQQMWLINGGNDTRPVKPIKPIIQNNSLVDDPDNACATQTLTQSGISG
jgi:hypothetical protein